MNLHTFTIPHVKHRSSESLSDLPRRDIGSVSRETGYNQGILTLPSSLNYNI